MKIVVKKEAAKSEIDGWLDARRIKPSVREAFSENIDSLVEAVMYGDITISGTVITQKLSDPIKDVNNGNVVVGTLEYDKRPTVDDLQKCTSSGDQIAISKEISAILTGKPAGIFGKLCPADFSIVNNIGVFFTS